MAIWTIFLSDQNTLVISYSTRGKDPVFCGEVRDVSKWRDALEWAFRESAPFDLVRAGDGEFAMLAPRHMGRA